jgi:MFS family permease
MSTADPIYKSYLYLDILLKILKTHYALLIRSYIPFPHPQFYPYHFIQQQKQSISSICHHSSCTVQLNMQAAFLISAKGFSEKQVGVLFLVFGLCQFLSMSPAGYFLDYSNRKIQWVMGSSVLTSLLTVLSVVTAWDSNDNWNMIWLIFCHALQGAMTAILPPAFNGITLGIVGCSGFTHQVSRNRMMNHVGTALNVAIGSVAAYFLYPNMGVLFAVSPLAALGVVYYLSCIIPTHVHRDAARALILESPTLNEYELSDEMARLKQQAAAALPWNPVPSATNIHATSSLSWCIPAESMNPGTVLASSSFPGPAVFHTHYPDASQAPQPPPSKVAAPRSHRWDAPFPTPSVPAYPQHPHYSSSYYQQQQNRTYQPPPVSTPSSTTMTATASDTVNAHDDSMMTSKLSVIQSSSSLEHAGGSYHISMETRIPDTPASYHTEGQETHSSIPSFNMGWWSPVPPSKSIATAASVAMMQDKDWEKTQNNRDASIASPPLIKKKAQSPGSLLRDPHLVIFVISIFGFHLANSSVLPLVMQSLSLHDAQVGILLSGLCIMIAQGFMTFFAKICGDYSIYWGRKGLMLFGFASLPLRCFLLTLLVTAEEHVETERGVQTIRALILLTQLLDSSGAGIIGTLQILVTSDLSGGTGRFSFLLGVTCAAMCLGATVSGYLGQALAQDYGYAFAFTALGLISIIPLALYAVGMPETLPEWARPRVPTIVVRANSMSTAPHTNNYVHSSPLHALGSRSLSPSSISSSLGGASSTHYDSRRNYNPPIPPSAVATRADPLDTPLVHVELV